MCIYFVRHCIRTVLFLLSPCGVRGKGSKIELFKLYYSQMDVYIPLSAWMKAAHARSLATVFGTKVNIKYISTNIFTRNICKSIDICSICVSSSLNGCLLHKYLSSIKIAATHIKQSLWEGETDVWSRWRSKFDERLQKSRREIGLPESNENPC